MAETLISPGVLARENDQSFVTSQPVERGAAIIGPTVLVPILHRASATPRAKGFSGPIIAILAETCFA